MWEESICVPLHDAVKEQRVWPRAAEKTSSCVRFVCVCLQRCGICFPSCPSFPLVLAIFCCCDKSNEVYGRVYSGLWFQRHKSPSRHGNRAASNRTATGPKSRKLITSTESMKQREKTGSETRLDNLKANPQWHPSSSKAAPLKPPQTATNWEPTGTELVRWGRGRAFLMQAITPLSRGT